jgi:uncharacterized tellurite resistance protein B-like protein
MADLSHMKLLVNLAQIDGTIAEREQYYIINIGRANGLYPDEVEPLFEEIHQIIIPQDMANEERFKYIFSLVQLMKIDERMYQEEILFCSRIAAKLGYDEEVMFELMLRVKAEKMNKSEIEELQSLTLKYLKR